MEEKKMPHTVLLENKHLLRITQVTDVDTFDEGKIVLFTEDDTMVIEGFDLHMQKLDVAGGELVIDGEITGMLYTGRDGHSSHGKGFFKKMFK